MAERVITDNNPINFVDLYLGQQTFKLEKEVGDFILKRKDGLFAYQLAVVVDDYEQGITHVIRGYDLLESTPKQRHIAKLLEFPLLDFGHIPLILGEDGTKLSKQAKSAPVELAEPISVLNRALAALGQPAQAFSDVDELLLAASKHWARQRVPTAPGIPLATLL